MDDRVKRPDEKFCHECGEIIRAKAEICPKCGCRQSDSGVVLAPSSMGMGVNSGPRSRTTAAILAILLGGLGAHKFYLGKPLWGVLYLVFVLTFIPAIVSLFEGVWYLMMSDADFQKRFRLDKLDDVVKLKFSSVEIASPDTHVKCPDCRAVIPADARVCQYCGCKLIAQ